MSHKIVLGVICLFLLVVASGTTAETVTSEGKPGADVNDGAKTSDETVIIDNNEVIISVGDSKLTMENIRWMDPAANEARIGEIADQWLTTELLYAEAQKQGIVDLPKAKFMAERAGRLAFSRQLRFSVANSVGVTDAEVLEFYEKNKNTSSKLSSPGMLSFSHIRTKTLEQAQAALERVKAGEDIGELARQLSIYIDNQRGGVVKKYAYDVVQRHWGEKFFRALINAEEGQLIGPVEIDNGFHEIARHEGNIAPKPYPFEEVKEKIKEDIKSRKARKADNDLVESLRGRAADKIYRSPKIFSAEKTEDKKSDK